MRYYNDLTGEIEDDGTPNVVMLGGTAGVAPSFRQPAAPQPAPAPSAAPEPPEQPPGIVPNSDPQRPVIKPENQNPSAPPAPAPPRPIPSVGSVGGDAPMAPVPAPAPPPPAYAPPAAPPPPSSPPSPYGPPVLAPPTGTPAPTGPQMGTSGSSPQSDAYYAAMAGQTAPQGAPPSPYALSGPQTSGSANPTTSGVGVSVGPVAGGSGASGAASASLPPGYTSQNGSIYYNGQKTEGIDQQTGQAILAGGQRGANVADWFKANENAMSQSTVDAENAAALARMKASPVAPINALANDPTYADIFGSNTAIGSDGALYNNGVKAGDGNPALPGMLGDLDTYAADHPYTPPPIGDPRYLIDGQITGTLPPAQSSSGTGDGVVDRPGVTTEPPVSSSIEDQLRNEFGRSYYGPDDPNGGEAIRRRRAELMGQRPAGPSGGTPTLPPASGEPRPGIPERPNGTPTQPSRPVPTIPAMPQIPSVGGPPLTEFGPGNDLRSSQINPTASPGLTALDNQVSSAASAVSGGKSREQIANDSLDAFDLRAQPMIRDRQRAAGQRAAQFGRIGMGEEGVEQLRPFTDYLTERAALSKDLAAETASGDITDRLNRLSALSSTQGQRYGQEASARDEFRTERGNQNSMQRQAVQDAVQQFLLEMQAQDQEFRQGSTLAGIGYGNSPSNLFFGAGQQYGQNAGLDFDALAKLIGSLRGGG